MNDEGYRVLKAGAAASAALLVILAVAHTFGASFLELQSRWLVLTGAPLLVALFVGGYITKFKGFGIELETALRETLEREDLTDIPGLKLKTSDVAAEAEGLAKGSLDELHDLPFEKKLKVKRLTFVSGHHYIPEIIHEYLEALPDLQFVELRDTNGELIWILPREAIVAESLQDFVESLASGTLPTRFRPLVVKTFIRPKDSFLVAMEKLWNSGLNSLPVVEDSEIVGYLDRDSAFEKLAEALTLARLGR